LQPWAAALRDPIRKPRSGEHGCRTADEALAVIATRWLEADIAARLNWTGMTTGQGKTFYPP